MIVDAMNDFCLRFLRDREPLAYMSVAQRSTSEELTRSRVLGVMAVMAVADTAMFNVERLHRRVF